VLDIDGTIGVATVDYISSGLEHAADSSAELVILRMDTPGGLVSSMRDIVQAVLASPVPVATYVSPAGARADSAGTYILLASHIAAMSPTSHLGAATPVSLTGGDIGGSDDSAPVSPDDDATDATSEPDVGSQSEQAPADADQGAGKAPSGSAMERKVLNDSVAYIRSLAERYGRNADWAESAVVDAATLTANEALAQNVIEFVAENQQDLLQQLDGYEVSINSETRELQTADATVQDYKANWRIKLLSVISNPEIVLILGMIGLYGLMYEGWNPGAIVPGVVGIICLMIAAYGLQVIPVNYAGMALLVVGIGLMIAEGFAPSFGALGLGGIAAFVFGAIIMFDSGIPGFDISISFVLAIAIVAAAAMIGTASYLLKLRKRGAVSGKSSIVGGVGTAMEDFAGSGKVWLEGEAWAARSSATLRKGQQVLVRDIDGLTLDVEPLANSSTAIDPQPQHH
jgi:membrane-bound serine protease (ClpP class)